MTGLTEALDQYREEISAAEQPPIVRVAVEMSDSGILSVPEAFVTIELNSVAKTTFTDKVKSFFGSKEEKPVADEALETPQNATAEANATDSQSKTGTPSEAKKETKKIALRVEYSPTGPHHCPRNKKRLPLNGKCSQGAAHHVKKRLIYDLN